MNYKMVAIDLDDTLLNHEIEISEKNMEALLKAHEKGVHIVICTGRPTIATERYVKECTALDDTDYYITYNGAIVSSLNGNTLFEEVVAGDVLNDLIDLGRKYGVDIQLYDKKGTVVENYTRRTEAYGKLTNLKPRVIDDLKTMNSSYKVLFNWDDVRTLEEILAIIEKKYKGKVSAFFSKPNFLEILNSKTNKGLAVEHLAQKLNVKREEVIAIGDSFNDLFMIEYAGLGVCVQNGREAVKEKADYVTEATNNESAVAEVINKFILNN